MLLRARFPMILALLVSAFLASSAAASGADNNVEWNGLSHYPWQDRRPVCPVNGESFQVRFQSFRNDLTSASVQLIVGTTSTTIPATRIGTRGPYDLWAAQIPSTTSSTERYWIQFTDGSKNAYMSTAGISATVPTDASGFGINFTTFEHAPPGATLVNGGAAV